jgi:hypothetical protein
MEILCFLQIDIAVDDAFGIAEFQCIGQFQYTGHL